MLLVVLVKVVAELSSRAIDTFIYPDNPYPKNVFVENSTSLLCEDFPLFFSILLRYCLVYLLLHYF